MKCVHLDGKIICRKDKDLMTEYNLLPTITDKYEMSYIRKMGNPETNKTENELIIILPVGCYWSKQSGGCAYCGYQALVDEMRQTTAPYTYLEILRTEIDKYNETIDRVSFFVGGSFFEISKTDQIDLIKELNKHISVREICIETRPELVTEEAVENILNTMDSNKCLQIAFGIESSDDYIRNKVHKKGLSDEVYKRAMGILKKLNVKSLIYVFVKPPIANITDSEALEDAMRTISDSFDKGAYAVELECGYIVENSEMHELYKEGKYKPLSFWSIQKLVQQAISLKRGVVRLAYFSDTPKPIAGPSNCPKCDEAFIKMFDEYRKTLDPNILEKEIKCSCKKHLISF